MHCKWITRNPDLMPSLDKEWGAPPRPGRSLACMSTPDLTTRDERSILLPDQFEGLWTERICWWNLIRGPYYVAGYFVHQPSGISIRLPTKDRWLHRRLSLINSLGSRNCHRLHSDPEAYILLSYWSRYLERTSWILRVQIIKVLLAKWQVNSQVLEITDGNRFYLIK